MPVPKLSSLAVLALVLLAGCGGGGGGGGGSASKKSIGGFGVVGGPSGNLLPGLNSSITLSFNGLIDPATVSAAALKIVTIEDSSSASNVQPGILAQYSVAVTGIGDRLTITPTVEFSVQQVTFGFVAKALYEISFIEGIIKSVDGASMVNEAQSYFFRTPETAQDTVPGFPQAEAFLVDQEELNLPVIVDGNLDGTLTDDAIAFFGNPIGLAPDDPISSSPVRDVIFVFNDALQPQTIFNTVDNSSSVVTIFVNAAPAPEFKPAAVPATISVIHQQLDLTIVRWRTSYKALPPNGFFLVQVAASVEDLAGNSKLAITGDASPLLTTTFSVDALLDPVVYQIVETFQNDGQKDAEETSASWADDGELLLPLLGGGQGTDGPLEIDANGSESDPGATLRPLVVDVDYSAQRVSMPTVQQVSAGVFEPRVWELTSLVLPAGWTLGILTDRDGDGLEDPEEFIVLCPGHPLNGQGAPLQIKVTGDVDISGTIDVVGTTGPTVVVPAGPGDTGYTEYLGRGGDGAIPVLAAGAGGRGGDVLTAIDTDADDEVDTLAIALQSPPVPLPGAPFVVADPKRRGATGRSTVLTPSTLFDPDMDLSVLNTDPDLAALLAVSPDGKWIAYTSEETGLYEIYVRSYPDGAVAHQISVGGGLETVWSPSGELFYRRGDRFMSVEIQTEPELTWSAPRVAFETDFIDTMGRSFDVTSDGQRLYVIKQPNPPDGSRINVITNWRGQP